jgi:hypothetical protein|tara:strand:- start:175 stop:366 length:192 start_codon:yes stop_codon:yes gene_type:complete
MATSISISLLVFEWQTEKKELQLDDDNFLEIDFEEAIPITKAVEIKPKLKLNLGPLVLTVVLD